MTALTETVGTPNHAVVLGAGMALDAILQAIFPVAFALMHGLIALLQQHMHVVLAHPLRLFHALAALADVELGHQGIGRPSGRSGKQQDEQKSFHLGIISF
jgi:hypothetical protein